MIKMKITIDRPDFAALDRGELLRIHKAAGDAAMEWFLRERLPKRFDGSMAGELFWKERDERWRKTKAGRGLSGVPHRWTGKTVAAFRRAVKRVTPKFLGFKVAGLGPQYGRFNEEYRGSRGKGRQIARKTKSSKPRMREEIARLTDWEVAQIGEIYARVFVDLATKELVRRRVMKVLAA